MDQKDVSSVANAGRPAWLGFLDFRALSYVSHRGLQSVGTALITCSHTRKVTKNKIKIIRSTRKKRFVSDRSLKQDRIDNVES